MGGVYAWRGSTELARTVATLAVEVLERSRCTLGRSGVGGGWLCESTNEREVVEEFRLGVGEGSAVGSFEV